MVLPLQNLRDVSMGETIDLVVLVSGHSDSLSWGRELWYDIDCKITEPLALGVWTLYNYVVEEREDFILAASANSRRFQKPKAALTPTVPVKEICAGMGGITIGAQQLGFRSLVLLDVNPLACAAIRRNGGRVLQMDITTAEAKQQLHAVEHETASLLAAGFPCQPFSRQGDGRGFEDSRAQTFVHVLLATWLLQPEGLILECAVEASSHPLVRVLLTQLCEKMHWTQHHVRLDLVAQWPCRRCRWWCILVPGANSGAFTAWPQSQSQPCIQEVIPEWPVWKEAEVAQLLWDEEECKHFLDPDYGSDQQLLNQKGVAPTTLRPCPCGCRGSLSPQRLRASGLRGFGVLGGDGSFRHPHPQEVGLLNGISISYRYDSDLRAALCLIGQVASPLQAGWVFAQVRRYREDRLALPIQCQPEQELARIKHALLQERHDNWILLSMFLPRSLHICPTPAEEPVALKIATPVRVSDLTTAEAQLVGPGSKIGVFAGKRRLEHSAFLHSAAEHVYTLDKQPKCQARTGELRRFLICVDSTVLDLQLPQGVLPCQVLDAAGLPQQTCLRDANNQQEVPRSGRLFGRQLLDARELQQQECESDALTDISIVRFLEVVARVMPAGQAVISPRAASLLRCATRAGLHTCFNGEELASADCVHVIAEANQHWFLLTVDLRQGQATHWDPFPDRTSEMAKCLLDALGHILEVAEMPLQARHVSALGDSCCGAVALCHLMLAMGMIHIGSKDLVNWIQVSAFGLSEGPVLHIGAGGLSADNKTALSELLVAKGVPEDKVNERVADAMSKVGLRKIEEGLRAQRPWAALKAVATGAAKPFRWLKADELEAQIRKKADNKFGTAAGEARTMKRAMKQTAPKQAAPQLDPRQLVLIEGTFVTDDGTAVPGVSLENVTVNAHGIAVCSPAQAQPFMDEDASISVEPLAIISTAPLTGVEATKRSKQDVRFPAVCGPTSEPILVAGTLVQLGDSHVKQAESQAKADQVRTGVVKVTVYKDQWRISRSLRSNA